MFSFSSWSDVKNVPAYRSGGSNGDEHEIGRQLEFGHARQEADGDPPMHEHDR